MQLHVANIMKQMLNETLLVLLHSAWHSNSTPKIRNVSNDSHENNFAVDNTCHFDDPDIQKLDTENNSHNVSRRCAQFLPHDAHA